MKTIIVIYFIASYLRQLSVDIKMRNYKIETSFLATRGWRTGLNKLALFLWFIFLYLFKIVCNSMLNMIFQYNWEPVLIQRKFIGFWIILAMVSCFIAKFGRQITNKVLNIFKAKFGLLILFLTKNTLDDIQNIFSDIYADPWNILVFPYS